jgi:hypothetical protein
MACILSAGGHGDASSLLLPVQLHNAASPTHNTLLLANPLFLHAAATVM